MSRWKPPQDVSPLEAAALERFRDFFSNLTAQSVEEQIETLYAQNVHFNDTLKTVRGRDRLKQYLIHSAEAVEMCRVQIVDSARASQGFYLRWCMDIRFKRFNRGQTTRSMGMSHIRFDQQGLIEYHQDYWDSGGGFFQYLPFVGRLVRAIRKRL
ncbi:MAG TPA: nuclear transport factor 2 family protein [Acidobacteriota bacterium]|nr:nuclear transport factor 2 family protein [Acidobacteriota bacterium]